MSFPLKCMASIRTCRIRWPALLGALLLGGSSACHCCTADDPHAKVYQVVIDGRSHQFSAGRQQRIRLSDGKEIDVTVRLSPKQPYGTDSLQFDYDAQLSLNDDKDVNNRTIVLMDASGCGIVITEYGRASDTNQSQLLKSIVNQMLARVKRGVATNITTGQTRSVTFPNAKGITTQTKHSDEDNDRMTYYYFALQAGDQAATVIGFHDADGEQPYLNFQKTVLESLRALDQR